MIVNKRKRNELAGCVGILYIPRLERNNINYFRWMSKHFEGGGVDFSD